ncbi:uncharacterized protein LOC132088419 [Daphnia carinata]|uniref:uncharacterized protein LOC132088419 n=1 Tax=Daphnia carinata TaxID=120202 RepID=UPI0028694426|nr:uncharacterized protein LOC132088419 [Daphnia carinata]
MNFIRSLFVGTKPIWTVGFPTFTLLFFLPYWFILCPFVWHRRHEDIVNHRAWNSPWLYGYWLAATGVWVAVFLVALCCWKQNDHQCDDTEIGSGTYLLSSQHSKNSVPFCITPLPVQPKKEEREVPSFKGRISEVDVSFVQVQPMPLKTMPASRPSELDFTWDNEDIQWLIEGNETTDPTNLDSLGTISLESLTGRVRIEEIPALIASPTSHSPLSPGSENADKDYAFLGVEQRTDYYQLTPTGSPPSPSFMEHSAALANQFTSEMENFITETKFHDDTNAETDS